MRLSSFRFFALLAAALVLAFGAGLWASQQKTTGVSPGAPPKWEYRVVTEPGSVAEEARGRTLMREGFDIRLETAMSSRLLLLDARD